MYKITIIIGLLLSLNGCTWINYVFNVHTDEMKKNRDHVVAIGKNGFPTLGNDANPENKEKTFIFAPNGGFVALENKVFEITISKKLFQQYLTQFVGSEGRRIALSETDKEFRGDYINITKINSIKFNDEGYIELSLSAMAKFKTMFARPSLRINEIKLQIRPGILTIGIKGKKEGSNENVMAITGKFAISYLDVDNVGDSFDKGIAVLLTKVLNQNIDDPNYAQLGNYQDKTLFKPEHAAQRIELGNQLAKSFGQVVAIIDNSRDSSDDVLLSGITSGYMKIENNQLIIVGQDKTY